MKPRPWALGPVDEAPIPLVLIAVGPLGARRLGELTHPGPHPSPALDVLGELLFSSILSPVLTSSQIVLLKNIFIYLYFRERGVEGARERTWSERGTWIGCLSHTP